MKKILHVGKYYPPCCGGIEQVAYDIASGLREKNYEQRVICFNEKPVTVRDAYEGVDVLRVGFKLRLLSQPITFSYFSLLKKTLLEFKPDLVHLHMPNPLIATYVHLLISAHTKLILHWHSDIIKQKITGFFYKPFEYSITKRADRIIAATRYHVDFSPTLKHFREKTVIIPFCVDTSKFLSVPPLPRNEKQLFFLGRHVPYKGLRYLLAAVPLIDSEAHIIIAGQGPLTESLKKAAAGFSNVTFTGQLTSEEVNRYFASSKLFIFPSITKNEAFGIAMIEAMYFGLPVVSFAIPGSGVNWVNQHEKTGLCVENKNVHALAEAVNRLLSNTELYNTLSRNAREWALTQCNKENFIKKICSAYEN